MREIKYEKIGVEYIDHMGSDIRVSNVAKVSFNKWDDENTSINVKQTGLLNYLATGLPSDERDDWEKRANASTHFSPFCHAFITVRCSAPIFLARQLVKHQVGLSWNEESRRYITDDIALWLPDVVHKKPEKVKQGASQEAHNHLMYENSHAPPKSQFENLTAKRVVEKSSNYSVNTYYDLLEAGVAPEEARIVLPLNSMTHWVWSGSVMAFMRVIKQRVDGHAQNAAQEFGQEIRKIVVQHFPESVKAFNL